MQLSAGSTDTRSKEPFHSRQNANSTSNIATSVDELRTKSSMLGKNDVVELLFVGGERDS